MFRNPMKIRPTFQWLFQNDICKFESYMPSQAVPLFALDLDLEVDRGARRDDGEGRGGGVPHTTALRQARRASSLPIACSQLGSTSSRRASSRTRGRSISILPA